MSAVLTELVGLLVDGIEALGEGIGTGVNSFVTDLFLTTSTSGVTGLSTFGGTVAIFGGVSLAVALTTKIFSWITSLGN